jgi:hypothetical protein
MDKKNCSFSTNCSGCPYFVTSEGTSCCINTKGERRVNAEMPTIPTLERSPRTHTVIVIGAGITGVI